MKFQSYSTTILYDFNQMYLLKILGQMLGHFLKIGRGRGQSSEPRTKPRPRSATVPDNRINLEFISFHTQNTFVNFTEYFSETVL